METAGKFVIEKNSFPAAHTMLWYIHIKAHDYQMNWTTEN